MKRRSPPALDAVARGWLQTQLKLYGDVESGLENNYPKPLLQWISEYRAFYQLPPEDGEKIKHSICRLEKTGAVVQAWIPPQPKGTLFFIHGYLDHVGICRQLIRFVLDQGFSYVGVDLPGHGLSEGKRVWIDDFSRYSGVLDELITKKPEELQAPFYLAGQSMGAAVVSKWLFEQHGLGGGIPPFEGVALFAPLVRPKYWQYYDWLFKVLRLVVPATLRTFSTSSHDISFLKFQKNDDPLQSRWIPWRWLSAMVKWVEEVRAQEPINYPLLIVQGTDDETIDTRYNLAEFCRCFPYLTLVEVEGARHHMINESPEYRDQIFSAMKTYFNW